MKKKFLILVGVFGIAILAASFNLGGNETSALTLPYTNAIVGLSNSGTQPTLSQGGIPMSFSSDGRYVLFASPDSGLVSGDTNGISDLFVRDRLNNTTTRVDVDSSGNQATQNSSPHSSQGVMYGKISPNGQYVVFTSDLQSLEPTAFDYNNHVYLHNMNTGSTAMLDVGTSGAMPTAEVGTDDIDISRDGRYVVFTSQSTNLVTPTTAAGRQHVYVRDTKLGTTTLMSKSDTGTPANANSYRPAISCDGSEVSFISDASNLVSGDTNGFGDIFLVNRIGGDTIRDLTVTANATSYSGSTGLLSPAISCDDSTVLVPTKATNLVSGVTGANTHLYAYNTQDETFELVDQSSGGTLANSSVKNVALSGDGRLIVFETAASNLDSSTSDSNSLQDIYLRDRKDATTVRVDKPSATVQSNAGGDTESPSISSDGRYVGFTSSASNLVSGDTNGQYDTFAAQTGVTPTLY